MKLYVNYITHDSCPLEVREKLSLSESQIRSVFKKAKKKAEVHEFTILQTCNRLEFYGYCSGNLDFEGFVSECLKELKPNHYRLWSLYGVKALDSKAVEHLFRVSAGIESQVIGESQILSQVKGAYTLSIDHNMSSLIFHKLFHHAFRVGKAVRTHTDINCGAVSISQAAVELVRSKVSISQSKVLLIGAGDNAQLTAGFLLEAGLKSLVVANRNLAKARTISSKFPKGKAIHLDNFNDALGESDIVIASTASENYIITEKHLPVLKHRDKDIYMVDLAVPRDIDPKVRSAKVKLYNIEDLNQQIDINLSKRQELIPHAERIVYKFSEKFDRWLSSLDLRPTIKKLTNSTLDLARSEAKRYSADFGPESEQKLIAFAESLARKFLHKPLVYLKGNPENPDLNPEQLQTIDIVNHMFLSQDEKDE